METLHTVIVGAGLAGLHVAEELAKANHHITVLERYPAYGGRVVTYRDDKIQYEIGAGRIFKDHCRLHALIKRFNLHTYPISTEQDFEHNPNLFLNAFEPIHKLLNTLPQDLLQQHTIASIVPESYKQLFKAYPYWGELHLLRADIALELFNNNRPMASKGTTTDFCGIKEGMDAITTHLAQSAQKAGADLRNRHRVHDIQLQPDGLFLITGDYGKKADAKPFRYTAHKVIIATSSQSYKQFTILAKLPILKQLATSPLTRIYAIYPKNSDNAVWFHDIKKQVTSNPLRYIIPIDSQQGLIMASYTDGDDTKLWHRLEGPALTSTLQAHLGTLFPDKTIPTPTYVKKHEWTEGCTYWRPGNYNITKAIQEAMNPAANLYLVGESISKTQTWMEGALESAEQVLEKFRTHT